MNTNTAHTHSNRPLWAAVAVLGVAVLAMGAALIRTQSQSAEPSVTILPAALAASAQAKPFTTPPSLATSRPNTEISPSAMLSPGQSAPSFKSKVIAGDESLAQNIQALPTTKTDANPVSQPMSGPRVVLPQNPEPAVARATAPARETCAACGTVENVTPVELEDPSTGAGAIAGGVLGAVVGNQVGGGNGKTLATILGAGGGGMTGNTVEKKMKKVTQYDVSVRMDDGSHRTLRQSTPPAVGSAVIVNGDSLQPATR